MELVSTDVLNREALRKTSTDCSAAYYLVHSLESAGGNYAEADRQAARNMIEAAGHSGLERIIYLGGLGEDPEHLSQHLRSRAEVGHILGAGQVPVTTLRAAMIIGSGSISFEIVRYLMDRLPVMITPRWLETLSQPIAIRNVLEYLQGCLENPATAGQTYDIGGPDTVSYRGLLRVYEEEARLRHRWIVKVPVLTPRLSAYWIDLVTPISASIAFPLAEGLRNEMVCLDHRIREEIPLDLIDCRQAIRLALDEGQYALWKDRSRREGPSPPAEWIYPGDPSWAGGDKRRRLDRWLHSQNSG